LITSFVAGFYPSLVFVIFSTGKSFIWQAKNDGKNLLTRGLIVLQFALAIFLIIGTIAVNRQVNYLMHKNLVTTAATWCCCNFPIQALVTGSPVF
jgi:putative ABC transport system permease protein